MLALHTKPPGGWENTQLGEVEFSDTGGETVLVEIKCAGINPADDFLIQGSYPGGPKPPFVAGRDAAGTVIRPDPQGVFTAGQAVLVLQHAETDLKNGTFCQKRAFPVSSLAAVPDGWSLAEAAAAPLVYQTAWRALVDCGQLKKGMTVGVTGASGGVGSAAVQLAHRLGAEVVAFSRSEEKQEKLRSLGADHVFSPNEEDLKKRVAEAISGRGLDIVVENVGGDSLTAAVHMLASHGKVCVVGLLAGVNGPVPIPSLLFKQASIHGVLVSGYTPQEAQHAWSQIVKTLQQHDDRPPIDSTFAINDYHQAFDRLRKSPFGKVVLNI